MMTLKKLAADQAMIPAGTAWFLAELGECKGRQQLFTRQSPQRLKALREHALIESAVSSNRIEGIEVEQKRIGTLVFGRPRFQDRNEEEVAGYRKALNWVHSRAGKISVDEKTILELHRLSRGEIWDAGKYKDKDCDIIERYPDRPPRVRFKTVTAKKTPGEMRRLVELWGSVLDGRQVAPLVGMAAFNLDFLCIHPFRDGNGRVSRLLLLLQCYHLGFEVGRYISLERLIEQNKERYYETLEMSSQGWHEGKHDPWSYINYVLFIMKEAYREFETRFNVNGSPRGEKTEVVARAVEGLGDGFKASELYSACPGVSVDMIRHLLKTWREQGLLKCLGHGPGSKWSKTSKWGN